MKTSLLLGIATLLAVGCARAEIMGADSVEWLTCKSEIVAVGHVSSVTTAKGPDDVVYNDYILDVSENIKGRPAKQIPFRYRALAMDQVAWIKPGVEVLIFLSASDRSPISIFDLSKPLKNCFSRDLSVITDKSALLALSRTWSSSTITNSLQENVPFGSPVHDKLWGGSSVFLVVPAEEKFRARYLEMARSDKPFERQYAAAELWKFPGAETEKVLRDLLDDTSENIWTYSSDTISKIEYGVRAAAWRSLKALGRPVPDIPLERKLTPETLRAYRHDAWQKSFTEALPEGWKIASIEDGATMSTWDGVKTIVIVTCSNGTSECKWTLFPKEWNQDKLPKSGFLGMYEGDAQGGRYFYLQGSLPEKAKAEITRHFSLTPAP